MPLRVEDRRAQMPTLSCIITCKGRLAHLKESLPKVCAAGFDEVIVVDFDCPQSTADWCRANYPKVKAIKVSHQPKFNPSKARNIGARNALSHWLCFLDADVLINNHFTFSFRSKIRNGNFYPLATFLRHNSEDLHGLGGTVVCEYSAFSSVGGYDEVMADYGWEDTDFYQRLVRSGYRARLAPPGTIERVIQHGERAAFRTLSAQSSFLQNGFYYAAKLKLMDLFSFNAELPMSIREHLFAQITAGAQKWDVSKLDAVSAVTVKLPVELNERLEIGNEQQLEISWQDVNAAMRLRKEFTDRLFDNRYIDRIAAVSSSIFYRRTEKTKIESVRTE
jgi:glycosyltransferase involved in cell wall biosynthesis